MDGSKAEDGAGAALGTGATAVALAGTAAPYRSGYDDPVVVASVVLAVVALVTFLARRYEVLPRRVGAPVAAGSNLAILLGGTYALNQGVTHAFGLPVLGDVPTLLVALVGSVVAIGAASADYYGVSGRGIYRRTVAATTFGAVGIVGIVMIQVWVVIVFVVFLALFVDGTMAWADLPATDRIILSQVATVLGVGSVAVGYLVLTDRDWSFIDLEVPTVRDAGYVVGGFVVLVGAAVLLNALLSAAGTEAAGHSSFDAAEENPEILLVLIPASILVIGPFEELLYRNVIQKSLYAYFSRAGAVVVASIPFAIVHFPAYSGGHVGASLVSLGVVLSLSLILGALYAKTENLLVPALVHGLYNALLFYVNYLQITG